ncbi:hypothetical protein CLIB1423_02S05072 [[Candida] railenensis]|uniref:Uncharacterized protein n=1 Tax=[Candida] railenensis TaxID=45579 RepID=A0A9P0QLC7_9ASCO|nr:hypothetical protein CLIB1423_02S05072 [[Candida] railenensis]
MSLLDIVAFRYLNGIIAKESIPSADDEVSNEDVNQVVITFVHEMDNLGYMVDREVYDHLCDWSSEHISSILNIAKESVGANVDHKPMYPNFPEQVMALSETELYFNAFIHYWSRGRVFPNTEVTKTRSFLDEVNRKTRISLVTEGDLKAFFFTLLSSKTSIPESLRRFVELGLSKGWQNEFTQKIPFKETLCLVAKYKVEQGEPISNIVETTTDVLRIMAALSDSDIELKRRVKFKSMNRKTRRFIIGALERVINIDDVKKYERLWIIAFHSLHISEYGGRCAKIAAQFRNERNVRTYDTWVSEDIKNGNVLRAAETLSMKPSVFARSLDKLLRDSLGNKSCETRVLRCFAGIAGNIETKVMLQLLGHFSNRDVGDLGDRIVVTAGTKGKTIIVPKLDPLPTEVVKRVLIIIKIALVHQFKSKEDLFKGKSSVFIEPEVDDILLPLQLASISETKRTISRGSSLPLDMIPEDAEKKILRLFVYWVGQDIDLSAYFTNEDFSKTSQVSYTNLKNSFARHSGDITRAPDGASEFIDIDMGLALEAGHRYIAMVAFVFRGPAFVSHKTCFAGYMLREEMQSGEVFEPSTVHRKFDITSESRSTIPCLFDMKERKLVWLDSTLPNGGVSLNNIHTNGGEIMKFLQAFILLRKKKVSVPELVKLHMASNEGITLSSIKEEDSFVVGLGAGDLDVIDFAEINSKWI